MKKFFFNITTITSVVSLLLLSITTDSTNAQCNVYGQWDYIGDSGVPTMHAILEPGTNKVVYIARAKLDGQTQINGQYYFSTEFDFDTRTFRTLTITSNTFCSAGSYLPNADIINVGGAEHLGALDKNISVELGYNKARRLKPCSDGKCDWVQETTPINANRWYPTVEQLADGSLFIIGGSNKGVSINTAEVNVPSYEIYPPDGRGAVQFPFLVSTLPDNLYPAVHLLPDKNLFILANTKSVILDTKSWSITKNLPDIPGPPRGYPSTAGTILLPLTSDNNYQPEILVCGGTASDTFEADNTCGRILPLSANPVWNMEVMPFRRVMPDVLIMANGQILILNGCRKGFAGFDKCTDPALVPVLYDPLATKGNRFTNLQPAYIPRMYHSIAMTTLTGQVMVSGSNPNDNFKTTGPYPTDFRVEMFTPPFLCTSNPRPVITKSQGSAKFGDNIVVDIITYSQTPQITANIINSGFVTHSIHMSHRMVWLKTQTNGSSVTITMPPSSGIAPPGPYLLFILDNGVPSKAVWIQLTN